MIVNNSLLANQDRTLSYNFFKNNLYLMIFFLLLTPKFYFPFSGLPSIRLEEIQIILIIFMIVFFTLRGHNISIAWGLRQNLSVGFLLIITISILVGTFKGYSTTILEFTEFVKIFKYTFIYTVAFTFINLSASKVHDIEKVLHFILKISVILFIVTIQQYFNLFNLNEKYAHIVAPSQYLSLLDNYLDPRPVGMIGNPNELGFLFVLSLTITVFLIIKNKFSFHYILVLAINGLGLFLTLSRSSLVAFVVSLIVILIINFRKYFMEIKRLIRGVLFLFFIIISMVYLFLFTDFYNEIFWRFSQIINLSENSSWLIRTKNWQEHINLFLESPIFGLGPLGKVDFINTFADNEWLLLLRTFGIVGTAYFIVMFALPYFFSDKSEYRNLSLAMLLSASVYMIPALIFNSVTLAPFLFIVFSMNDKPKYIFTINK